MKEYTLLVINPGSTSTKISVFKNRYEVFEKTIKHSTEELSKFYKIYDQYDFRKNVILAELKNNKYFLNNFNAVVGRGGLLKPVKGGTYIVSDSMFEELKSGKWENMHPI